MGKPYPSELEALPATYEAAMRVDVRRLSRAISEVLDAVPTAKTIQGLGQLVLGVTLNSPDVGGSRAMQQTYFTIRGTGGAR